MSMKIGNSSFLILVMFEWEECLLIIMHIHSFFSKSFLLRHIKDFSFILFYGLFLNAVYACALEAELYFSVHCAFKERYWRLSNFKNVIPVKRIEYTVKIACMTW